MAASAPVTGAIPPELLALPQWVVWRREVREGKPTKVPYRARAGRLRAETDDPATWSAHQDALRHARANDWVDGTGYVFSSGDPYTGIDLDRCRDPETGELEEWAEMEVARLGGYAEVSPSGRGVHVIVKGRLPESARRNIEHDGRKIEAYSERRFFTVTGRAL